MLSSLSARIRKSSRSEKDPTTAGVERRSSKSGTMNVGFFKKMFNSNQKKDETAPTSDVQEPVHFLDKYILGPVLGSGAYSNVHLATSRTKGEKFATKVVGRANLSKDDEESLRSEVEILMSLDHPCIVKLYEWFEEDDFYYLVLEMCDGGELFDRIVERCVYTEETARDLVHRLLEAMVYCHDRNVMHRDLKPENLLLTSRSDDAAIKLADFGFAKKIASGAALSVQSQCGTPGYVAPEILKRLPYGKAVDMWSTGVITYILLGGYPPFHDENQARLFNRIKKGKFVFHDEYWSNISPQAKDLISRMLTVDPEARITAAEALKHPWITTAGSVLSQSNLNSTLKSLRYFNARRKFRTAITSVVIANRLTSIIAARDIRQHYAFGSELGRGAFSVVYAAKCLRKGTDHEEVAIKCVQRRNLSYAEESALRVEMDIMVRLRHPNIVRLIDSFTDNAHLYMVMEVVKGGELFQRIVEKVTYKENEARDVIRGLLEAIAYCHANGIVHRDLKPENVLLVDEADSCRVKVADFGFAEVLPQSTLLNSQCGTPGYVAPEILNRQPYGAEVDLWSLGVIGYILLGGYPPFHDTNQARLFQRIKKGVYKFHDEYWSEISQDAKDLISRMLTVDQKKRITAAEALQHPYLQVPAANLDTDMYGTAERMRLFNARRKMRSAIGSIIAINRMKRLGESMEAHGAEQLAGLPGDDLADAIKKKVVEDVYM